VLTPEKAIDVQFDLGVDMMVCLDDPRPNDAPPEELRAAVDRTLRWAKRCKQHYELRMSERTSSGRPLLFGVVQGGLDVNLRRECADGLATIGFDGYGFGARHVDMEGNFLEEILRATASFIPENALRFALGIGSPSDIVRCARLGWDMFDCVIPTREGRHGRVFVRHRNRSLLDEHFSETFSITNERFKEDFGVIDPECLCAACANGFSRGYIRHLFSVGEPLGPQLLSLHNLSFYADLMKELRGHISPSGGSL
jgi:queuine tRNA-ribosyltransferase